MRTFDFIPFSRSTIGFVKPRRFDIGTRSAPSKRGHQAADTKAA